MTKGVGCALIIVNNFVFLYVDGKWQDLDFKEQDGSYHAIDRIDLRSRVRKYVNGSRRFYVYGGDIDVLDQKKLKCDSFSKEDVIGFLDQLCREYGVEKRGDLEYCAYNSDYAPDKYRNKGASPDVAIISSLLDKDVGEVKFNGFEYTREMRRGSLIVKSQKLGGCSDKESVDKIAKVILEGLGKYEGNASSSICLAIDVYHHPDCDHIRQVLNSVSGLDPIILYDDVRGEVVKMEGLSELEEKIAEFKKRNKPPALAGQVKASDWLCAYEVIDMEFDEIYHATNASIIGAHESHMVGANHVDELRDKLGGAYIHLIADDDTYVSDIREVLGEGVQVDVE